MIDGLKLHIRTEEFRKLLQARADYHAGRAATKEAELPKLRATIDTIKRVPGDAAQGRGVSSNSYHVKDADPVEALEQDIEAHKRKSSRFAFYASHLAESETYVLTASDVGMLELVMDDQ